MLPTVPTSSAVCFGVFEADLRSGELRKKGAKVKIQELPFRALRLFLSRPNEVLSREDFRAALWPDDVFVDFDRGITSAINRLRDALGDSAENPVFVETVGRRGYRWIAPTYVPPEPVVAQEPLPVAVMEPELVAEVAQAPKVRQKWPYIVATAVVVATLGVTGIYRWNAYRSHQPMDADVTAGAQRIANASLSPSQGFTHRPANHEAEELYLQGRFYWNKRTPESLTKAVDFFTQAIVHDPGYAQAYVGMADCYNLLREFSVMPSTEAYPRALAAAKKAVELDDQSSQAHASLAFASAYGRWDTATADKEFRRAIELDPNNSVAHHWYGTFLIALRRYQEALTEIERAQALDPTSNSVVADKGVILFAAGRISEATDLLKQVEETEPTFMTPHRELKYIYLETADYPNYLVESRKEAAVLRDSVGLAITLAADRAYAAGGGPAMLQAVREQQKRLYDQGLFSPYFLAETCAIMGDKRGALRYLQAAHTKRADGLLDIANDAAFRNMRDEPGFRDLVAKVGLPPLN